MSKAFSSNGANYKIGSGSITQDSNGNPITSVLPGLDAIGNLLGGQSNVVISSGSFDAVISFMATQGDLNVLSSPRVTASNNQKAVIKVGTDEYYVTDLSSVVELGITRKRRQILRLRLSSLGFHWMSRRKLTIKATYYCMCILR